MLVAALALAGIWAAFAAQSNALEERARQDALNRSAEIAASYETDVVTTLNLIDSILNLVASYAADNGIERTISMITRQHLAARQITSIAVVDRAGNGRYIGDLAAGTLSIGDLEHVQRALADPDNMIIGKPAAPTTFNRAVVPFARAIRASNGNLI